MKVQRTCETTPEIHFISPKKEFHHYWSSFLGSELDGIYQSIPWKEIVKSMKLKEFTKGQRKIFSP
jgi:hypothetical protein